MPLSLLPSLLLAILLVGYTPGPANLFSLHCSMRNGVRRALVMWLGLLTGFTIATAAAALVTHWVGTMMGRYSGMFVQLTNAKIILFDLMAYTTFVLPYSNHLSDLLLVAVLLEIAGPGANLVYLFAGSTLLGLFTAHPLLSDRIMAALLAVCAAYILLS